MRTIYLINKFSFEMLANFNSLIKTTSVIARPEGLVSRVDDEALAKKIGVPVFKEEINIELDKNDIVYLVRNVYPSKSVTYIRIEILD